jgi:hypothetical protein
MTDEAKDELPEIAIRLGESDGFRRSQVFALSDALAAANGELAVLRSKIASLRPKSRRSSPTPETWN